MSIPFTQYLRPDGEKRDESIDRPAEIETRAGKLIVEGVRFEAEVLRTGEISLEALLGDESLASEVVLNGPEVLEAVDRLVQGADERFTALRGS